MTKIQFETSIVDDGTYEFPAREPYREYLVEALGEGTVQIGYVDGAGEFAAFDNDAATFIAVLPPPGKFAILGTDIVSISFAAGIVP